MWQKVLKPHVDGGGVVAVGVVQEQHPDRARLYRQWRRLDWPVFVDSLNLLDLAIVPVPIAIDESGMVRVERFGRHGFEDQVEQFLQTTSPRTSVDSAFNRAVAGDRDRLRKRAQSRPTAQAWRELGDHEFLHGGRHGVARSVDAYRQAVTISADDGRSHFRLGVALRRRFESAGRQPRDAQEAVEEWGLALGIDVNQYIWRRRIQQYGPRLDKPYNFYFWVEQARSELLGRGEEPVSLAEEPTGSELAPPAKPTPNKTAPAVPDPDPWGRIRRDAGRLVRIDPMVAPARVRPGERVRVRVVFRVNKRSRPYWNNQAESLTISVKPAPHFTMQEGRFRFPNPQSVETQEPRALEFEVAIGKEAPLGPATIEGYALYYVCENRGGKCHYLRQDFTVSWEIDPQAPLLR